MTTPVAIPGVELPEMDRAARIRALRSRFDDLGIDSLAVTKQVNLRWLCGFTGSAGMLLVTADGVVLVTDGRYETQAGAQVSAAGVDAEVRIASVAAVGPELGRRYGLSRVGVEAESLSWADAEVARGSWFPEAEIVATRGTVEALREIKDPGEVARIEAAAGIADRALAEVAPTLRGRTEVEVAVDLEARMRTAGAESPAFDTIVASGPNGALPHHRPSSRRIEVGDLVVIDMGATVDGYRSDMTRTFLIGGRGPGTATAERMLEVVSAAQQAGVDAVAAGIASRDVDAAARRVIADAGWADAFVHPTGHGVGLEIHERLRVAATSDATLAAGHVVTVEPGVYLPGIGGVRIEDTVEVAADGCRRLTRTSLPATIG